MKTPNRHFEINWPLVDCQICIIMFEASPMSREIWGHPPRPHYAAPEMQTLMRGSTRLVLLAKQSQMTCKVISQNFLHVLVKVIFS